MLKRMSYRKQKRWWNAYMLFYTRADLAEEDSTSPDSVAAQLAKLRLTSEEKDKKATVTKAVAPVSAPAPSVAPSVADAGGAPSTVELHIPLPIEKSIQKQNVNFLHQRNQFSPEFFQFMRNIISCNGSYITQQQQQAAEGKQGGEAEAANPPDAEVISMVTVHLASKFLFNTGFRTKKSLRGPAQEWYEILTQYMRGSRQVRKASSVKSICLLTQLFFCPLRFGCGSVRKSYSLTLPASASTSWSALQPRFAPPSSASSSSSPTSPWRTGPAPPPHTSRSTTTTSNNSSNSSRREIPVP